MIWIATALASTPAALKEELPAAHDSFAKCAERACDAEDVASAAFVIALGEYLITGVANGEMVGTVKLLQPARYDDLPEVLKTAGTEAPEWVRAMAVPENRPIDIYSPPPLPVEGRLTATFTVTDDSGPLPAAWIRFPAEGVERRASAPQGNLSVGGLLIDGTPQPFAKNDVVSVEIFMAGYAPLKAKVVLSGNAKRNRLKFRMTPLAPPEQAPEDLVEAWQLWRAHNLQAGLDPTPDNEGLHQHSRRAFAVTAAAWASAGNKEGSILCASTGLTSVCGG